MIVSALESDDDFVLEILGLRMRCVAIAYPVGKQGIPSQCVLSDAKKL